MTYQYLARFHMVKKNYKYVIGYLFGDYETKPLHVELPKTSTYIKRYDGQTKWICL